MYKLSSVELVSEVKNPEAPPDIIARNPIPTTIYRKFFILFIIVSRNLPSVTVYFENLTLLSETQRITSYNKRDYFVK